AAWTGERRLLPLVAWLAAGVSAGRRARRAALHGGRIGGGRPRGVSGVLIQAALQVFDLLLEGPDLGPQPGRLRPQRQDEGSGLGGQVVPKISREWRPCVHSADIARRKALGHANP